MPTSGIGVGVDIRVGIGVVHRNGVGEGTPVSAPVGIVEPVGVGVTASVGIAVGTAVSVGTAVGVISGTSLGTGVATDSVGVLTPIFSFLSSLLWHPTARSMMTIAAASIFPVLRIYKTPFVDCTYQIDNTYLDK